MVVVFRLNCVLMFLFLIFSGEYRYIWIVGSRSIVSNVGISNLINFCSGLIKYFVIIGIKNKMVIERVFKLFLNMELRLDIILVLMVKS